MIYAEDILTRMTGIFKPQIKYMTSLFNALTAFVGRGTATNLSRYNAGSAKRLYRWSKIPFDFITFNLELLKQSEALGKKVEQQTDLPQNVLVMDSTFLKKSGKHTWGLGYFYNGCSRQSKKVERGLEASVIGVVNSQEHTAYTLSATQTPAKLPEEVSRIDFYLQQVLKQCDQLLPFSQHLVVDGAYASKTFLHGVMNRGFRVVGRMRADSHLRYLYSGPRSKRVSGKGHRGSSRLIINSIEATLIHVSLLLCVRS